MTSPDQLSPASPPESGSLAKEPGDNAQAAAYLFLQPLVRGKSVLDVDPPPHGQGGERLREVGATDVRAAFADGARLDVPDRCADIVLCLGSFTELPDDVARHRWLAELSRSLRPGGYCVVRSGGGISGSALEDLLHHHFGAVQLVQEMPFLGVSYYVPGVEEVAINEDLAPLGGRPSHHLAFCAVGREPTWTLTECLLVPVGHLAALPGGSAGLPPAAENRPLLELQTRCEALITERDGLRETVMALEEQAQRREGEVAALRRQAERQLLQITNDAANSEVAHLEREQAERRAAVAEASLARALTQVSERDGDRARLEKEVLRLREAIRRREPA